MIEDWWDLFKFRVPWYDPDDDEEDEEAVFFCLHVLPDTEVEFEFESGVNGANEVDKDLVPDRLDRTGKLAFGDGVGIET